MAVARRVEVVAAEDGLVAVQRDVIIDPKSGVAAEVEKVVVAVDVGEGKVAVMEQARVKAVAVSNHPPSRMDPPPRYEQLSTPLLTTSAPRRDPLPLHFKEKNSGRCCHIVMCIIGLLIFALALVLFVAPTAGGTLACDAQRAAGQIFIACGVLALVAAVCYLISYCSFDFCKENVRGVTGVCCCVALFPLTAFVVLTIGETLITTGGVRNGTLLDVGGDLASCKNTEIPISLTALSWVLCLLLCGCGCFASYSNLYRLEKYDH